MSKGIKGFQKGNQFAKGNKPNRTSFKKGFHNSPSTEFKKGQKLSDETRKKISEAKKGRKQSEEHKRKTTLAKIGKPRSKETRLKLSEAGKKRPGMVGNKLGVGYKHTDEWKENMSKWHKANPVKTMLGKHHSEETKKKMSLAAKGNTRSLKVKGVTTCIDRMIRRMEEYKLWRSACFSRDKWTCQTCGFRGGYVTVHHIKGMHKIVKQCGIKNTLEARECKELWDINNGVTLCEECHKLTDNYKGRGIIKKILKS